MSRTDSEWLRWHAIPMAKFGWTSDEKRLRQIADRMDAAPDTAALSAQTEACRALSVENERLKARLAALRGVVCGELLRIIDGAPAQPLPDGERITDDNGDELEHGAESDQGIEAAMADDRNDDAWLEDRGLL